MKSTSTLLKSFRTENIDNGKGLKTGFPKFDEFTGGFKPGEIIIMAGRIGMGIDQLTKCFVLNTSIRHNNTVGVFSLDKSKETYLQRLLSIEAGISFYQLKTNRLSDKDLVDLNKAKEVVAKASIHITDAMSFSVQSIIAEAEERIKFPGVKLFVIHGFNLLSDNTYSGTSRNQELGRIAEMLRNFAFYNDITFVITHELPGIYYPNANQEFCPTIQEIYEDLPLAKYADLVTVLYRPEYYGIKTWPRFDESTECEAELRILKNRNGNCDDFRLFFEGYRARFYEIEDERFPKIIWKDKTD